jgi:hypothetical protein
MYVSKLIGNPPSLKFIGNPQRKFPQKFGNPEIYTGNPQQGAINQKPSTGL